MILTNCAACAAPLAHDAPRCVRCKTRYCDSTCQHDHKQICKKIHRGGNAEQYHANKKYKEAVAVAVDASSLRLLQRFEEAKSLFRNTIPVAQRFIGESDSVMLMIKMAYAETLYKDADATLDDLREAVTTLLEPERTARRVFGGSNPLTVDIEGSLRDARAALRARETPPELDSDCDVGID